MLKKIVPPLLTALIFLTACTTVIPGSVEAQERFEKAGYEVERIVHSGEDAEEQGLKQLVLINVYQGDKVVFQAYYFCSEEDCERFYQDHQDSLPRDQEVFRKNKYSIYRGTLAARDVFLGEG